MKTIIKLSMAILFMGYLSGCGDSGSSSSTSPSPSAQNQRQRDDERIPFNQIVLEVDGQKIDILNCKNKEELEIPGVKVLSATSDAITANLELSISYPKAVTLWVSTSENNPWHYTTQYNVRRSSLPNQKYTHSGSDGGYSQTSEKIEVIPFDAEQVVGGKAQVTLTTNNGDSTITMNLSFLF